MRSWKSVAAVLLSLPLLMLLLLARPASAAGGVLSVDLPANHSALIFSVSGKAPAGSLIESPVATKPITVDATGRFWLRLSLKEGKNAVVVTAKTPDEELLTFSGEINVDPKAPSLAAEVPVSFQGEALPVRGQVAAGTTVTVNGKAVQPGTNGIFLTTIDFPNEGALVKIVATDAAGKQNEIRRFVARSRSLAFSTATGRSPVTIKAPAGSTVRLLHATRPDTTRTVAAEPVLNDDGEWSGYLPVSMGWNYFWLQVTTPEGERYFDLLSVQKVIDVIMPVKTNLAKVNAIGTVLPGWSVKVAGKPVPVSEKGEFAGPMALAEGTQQIVVEAYREKPWGSAMFNYVVTRVPAPEPLYEQQLTITLAQPGETFLFGGKTYAPDLNGDVRIPMALQPGRNLVIVPATNRTYVQWVHVYDVTYVPTTVVKLTVDMDSAEVDGTPTAMPVAPKIRDGSTYLPLRFLGEVLGAKVEWDAATRTVTYTRGFRVIKITVGESRALVDGKEVQLTAPAVLENDRTLVPVRFISENLGAKVAWDGATRTVTVTMPKE